MDVNHPPKRVPVSILKPAQPQNPGDNRIPARRVDRHHLPGGLPAFKLHPQRLTAPNLPRHPQPAQRRGVAPRYVSESKLGGGYRVLRHQTALLIYEHPLLRHADPEEVFPVPRTTRQKKQEAQRKAHGHGSQTPHAPLLSPASSIPPVHSGTTSPRDRLTA